MKSNYLLWIVGGVIIVVLIIMGARRGDDSGGGRSANQNGLERAVANLVAASSYHTETELTLDLPSRQSPAQLVDVTMKLEGDVKETENDSLFAGDLFIEAKGRGLVLFTEGQLRALPDTVAFRLDSLPALLNPEGTLAEKWTHVDTSVLRSNNTDDINQTLLDTANTMLRRQVEEIPGADEEGMHYQGQLTAEQEEALIDVMRQGVSGSPVWNVIARLLRSYDVRVVDAWVREKGTPELRRLVVEFESPQAEGSEDPVAVLTMNFSDFGKDVEVQLPEEEIAVSPEVFGRLFGEGDLDAVPEEESAS